MGAVSTAGRSVAWVGDELWARVAAANIKKVPDRADFDPVPWHSMAVWMLTQMQRWGYLKGDVNYRQIAERVFLMTDAAKHMKDLGQPVTPASAGYRKFKVMGKECDPAKAAEYTKSFAIAKMG